MKKNSKGMLCKTRATKTNRFFLSSTVLLD